MRRILLLTLCFAIFSVRLLAQNVATFEDLYLPATDTFYVDYSSPGMDIGFNDGLCYFPCIYDTTSKFDSVTSAGDTVLTITPHWRSGFVYSNVTDTLSDSLSRYSAIAGSGFGSNKYVVAHGVKNYMSIVSDAAGKPLDSIMITNSAYAYNAMQYGGIQGKKFTNSGQDWFRVKIDCYSNYRHDTAIYTYDTVQVGGKDSVITDTTVTHVVTNNERFRYSDTVYLANFQGANSFILNGWTAVHFRDTVAVDSVVFTLSSSDNTGSIMNTPAYFCLDNVTTFESSASVHNVNPHAAKVYPNPTTNTLHVSMNDNTVKQLNIVDMSGRVVCSMQVTSTEMSVNTSSLKPGMYILQLVGTGQPAAARFVKQ